MRRTSEKGILLLLVILTMGLVLLWVFESHVRSSLTGTVWPLSVFHGYMIGLVFPVSLYFKAVWNVKSERPHNPFTGRFITFGVFGLVGALIAIGGCLFVNWHLVPFFERSFLGFVGGPLLVMIAYGVWAFVSIPILAIMCVAIASPAGPFSTMRSIHRHL